MANVKDDTIVDVDCTGCLESMILDLAMGQATADSDADNPTEIYYVDGVETWDCPICGETNNYVE